MCRSFGFESAFGVSSVFLIMNSLNCVVLLTLILLKALTHSKVPRQLGPGLGLGLGLGPGLGLGLELGLGLVLGAGARARGWG